MADGFFDQFPKLDADLDHIFRERQDAVDPATTALYGLEEATRAAIAPEMYTENEAIDQEIAAALQAWDTYPYEDTQVPDTLKDFMDGYLPGKRKLRELYRTREQFKELMNPAGESIGDTMELVLVPWQELQENFVTGLLKPWLKEMFVAQKPAASMDFYPDIKKLLEGTLFRACYRDPDSPERTLDLATYLGKKIQQDGKWGVMLMQTNDVPGLLHAETSPHALTDNGRKHLTIDGKHVDAMGMFEYFALTLQTRRSFSATQKSWLLANAINAYLVPCAGWQGDILKVMAMTRNHDEGDTNVRLAIA